MMFRKLIWNYYNEVTLWITSRQGLPDLSAKMLSSNNIKKKTIVCIGRKIIQTISIHEKNI